MIRWIDRALAALLILGAIAHSFGVLDYYRGQPDALYWSLCAGVLIVLVAAINLLRSWRPNDAMLAWIAASASGAYLGVTIGFGRLIHDMTDPRVIGFGLIALLLAGVGVRDAVAAGRGARQRAERV